MQLPQIGARVKYWEHTEKHYGRHGWYQHYHITTEYIVVNCSEGIHIWKAIGGDGWTAWELKRVCKSFKAWMGV